MVLCYRCKERPIPPVHLKHQHMRCYKCHAEQYKEPRARVDHRYHAKPESKKQHNARQRAYRKRSVRISGRRFYMPTVEIKEQAAEQIRQLRQQFRRQQGA